MNIKKLEDFQLRDLIENLKSQKGTRQNGLDGLSHWSTVHPVDFYDAAKGTYCNDYTNGVTVSGVLTGGPLAVNSFLTVWQDMANRKSESGEKMNLTPDLTMVPVTLKGTAATILQTQFFGAPIIGNIGAGPGPNYALAGSTENALRGMSDILIWPDLGSVTNWYQLVTNKPRKPFSWIMRQAPNWVYRNMPTDPIVFDTHSFVYGSYARGAPAWSFAWLSSRSG
jgi:phage major head subunit gpT-like protein